MDSLTLTDRTTSRKTTKNENLTENAPDLTLLWPAFRARTQNLYYGVPRMVTQYSSIHVGYAIAPRFIGAMHRQWWRLSFFFLVDATRLLEYLLTIHPQTMSVQEFYTIIEFYV